VKGSELLPPPRALRRRGIAADEILESVGLSSARSFVTHTLLCLKRSVTWNDCGHSNDTAEIADECRPRPDSHIGSCAG
jgi:hypothetical protein